MAQQEGYPRGRGPGYANAAGFEPNGQGPRMRPPATPEPAPSRFAVPSAWQGAVGQQVRAADS